MDIIRLVQLVIQHNFLAVPDSEVVQTKNRSMSHTIHLRQTRAKEMQAIIQRLQNKLDKYFAFSEPTPFQLASCQIAETKSKILANINNHSHNRAETLKQKAHLVQIARNLNKKTSSSHQIDQIEVPTTPNQYPSVGKYHLSVSPQRTSPKTNNSVQAVPHKNVEQPFTNQSRKADAVQNSVQPLHTRQFPKRQFLSKNNNSDLPVASTSCKNIHKNQFNLRHEVVDPPSSTKCLAEIQSLKKRLDRMEKIRKVTEHKFEKEVGKLRQTLQKTEKQNRVLNKKLELSKSDKGLRMKSRLSPKNSNLPDKC